MLDLLLAIAYSYFHFYKKWEEEGYFTSLVDPNVTLSHDGIEHGVVELLFKRNIEFGKFTLKDEETERLTRFVQYYLSDLSYEDMVDEMDMEKRKEDQVIWNKVSETLYGFEEDLRNLSNMTSTIEWEMARKSNTPEEFASHLLKEISK